MGSIPLATVKPKMKPATTALSKIKVSLMPAGPCVCWRRPSPPSTRNFGSINPRKNKTKMLPKTVAVAIKRACPPRLPNWLTTCGSAPNLAPITMSSKIRLALEIADTGSFAAQSGFFAAKI